ncbi:MAG TPA: histidine kinase [Nevskiaceae bacterium]|nr:histidine kinase [Nevskiaceae bacterium]
MERVDPTPDLPDSVIPNFCRARALVPVAFVMQLVATVLTLADLEHAVDALRHYLLTSLYLQWLGLTCAAVLCWARGTLSQLPPRLLFLTCWAVMMLVTLAVSLAAWHVAKSTQLLLIAQSREAFLISTLSIGALISPLLLRYFWLQQQWREQIRAEGEARYQALHARIRPHFLFNSLNSVAELIATRPGEAERMIEDMSDLFRATLGQHRQLAPLAAEIELMLAYLRIEQVRLGDKLKVEWQVGKDVLDIVVPPLSLQPLVENAIVHGVSRRVEGGVIRIMIRRDGADLVVQIENPVAQTDATSPPGSRTAVRNIAQRLALIYGPAARIDIGQEGETFRATVRLPVAQQSKAAA